MLSVSNNLTNKLVENEIISKEDYEVYQFGIESFIMKAIHIITYLMIGLLLQKMRDLIIFLITFIPLRVYAGGYHAKTRLNCYLISCGTIVSVIFMIKAAPTFIMHYSIIWALVASLFLLIIAPVESSNKPLDDLEKVHYKRKAGVMILLDLSLVIVLQLIKLDYISFIITLSLTYELGIALLGKVFKDSH